VTNGKAPPGSLSKVSIGKAPPALGKVSVGKAPPALGKVSVSTDNCGSSLTAKPKPSHLSGRLKISRPRTPSIRQDAPGKETRFSIPSPDTTIQGRAAAPATARIRDNESKSPSPKRVRRPRPSLPAAHANATGDSSGRQETTSKPIPDQPRQANGTTTSPKHGSSSFLRNKLPPLPKDDTKPPASALLPTERNTARLKLANEGDHKTMSKYLPSSLESFLMAPVVGPDDYFNPAPSFMDAIREVAKTPAPVPKAPPIHFSTNPEALKHNAQLLQSHQYSMESLISRNNETTLAYGSEFRPIHQLESILGKHLHFQQLLTILQEGMDFRFSRALTEAERSTELDQILARGNHKSAEDEPRRSRPTPIQGCNSRVLDANPPPRRQANPWGTSTTSGNGQANHARRRWATDPKIQAYPRPVILPLTKGLLSQ
jgi:hypothetical protein